MKLLVWTKDDWKYSRMSNGLFLQLVYLKMRETKTDIQMIKPSVVSEVVKLRLSVDKKLQTKENIKMWEGFVHREFYDRIGSEVVTLKSFVEEWCIPDRFLKMFKLKI